MKRSDENAIQSVGTPSRVSAMPGSCHKASGADTQCNVDDVCVTNDDGTDTAQSAKVAAKKVLLASRSFS